MKIRIRLKSYNGDYIVDTWKQEDFFVGNKYHNNIGLMQLRMKIEIGVATYARKLMRISGIIQSNRK